MKFTVSVEGPVGGPAEKVYALLADYRTGHPRVLPPAFTGLQVVEGGIGAGTVIDVGMKAFGRVRTVRGYVTEPEPGRVLEESYPAAKIATRFYITPFSGSACTVRIWSELNSMDGAVGWLERKLVTRFLLKVYRQELKLIDEAVR